MASTPSASALSAVLRCRGNIWARNPPTKRPPASAFGLGLAGGALRDSPPPERTGSEEASAWEAFLLGERAVVVGRRLTVSYKRDRDSRKMNKSWHPKLSQSPGDARSAVPGVQNALVRQLARILTSKLPGIDSNSETNHVIKYQTHGKNAQFSQDTSDSPAGVVKVSTTSLRLREHAGPTPSFLLSGWSALKSTCLSLTHLVSEFVFLKLVVLCRSSSSLNDDDAPQQLDGKHSNTDAVQANEQINKDNCGSGSGITEDRPD